MIPTGDKDKILNSNNSFVITTTLDNDIYKLNIVNNDKSISVVELGL